MNGHARVALFAAIAILATGPASASDHLLLNQGESRYLPVAGAAASVVVGAPGVADATVVSSHSVVVWGKSFGTSEIMAFDQGGHMLLDKVVVVGAGGDGGGHMTLYRGVKPSEYACTDRCVSLDPTAGSASPGTPFGGASGGGSSAPSPSFSAAFVSVGGH